MVFLHSAELVGVAMEDGMGAESTIKDDIAYMRGLAEAGRRGPVLGASILFVSGLIYGLAAIGSWFIHSGRLGIQLPVPGLEWWIAGAVQIAFVVVMSRRLQGQTRQGNPSSRLFGVVWSSLGVSILVFVLALAAIQWAFGVQLVWLAMPAFVMTVYGIGWSVSAMLVQRLWMHGVAAVSFLAAISTAFTVMLPNALGLLVYAALILLVVAAPGYVRMREAKPGERPA